MIRTIRPATPALCVVACLILAAMFGGSPAAAHGVLKQTTPADGDALSALPEEVAIRFEEPHRVTLVQIVDAEGEAVRLTINEGLAPSEAVTAATPSLAPGDYRLEWRALAPDGHPTKGEASFSYAPE